MASSDRLNAFSCDCFKAKFTTEISEALRYTEKKSYGFVRWATSCGTILALTTYSSFPHQRSASLPLCE
ncbi:hypothetical protein QMA12_19545 [Pseudoalteromonas sp. APC 3893]|nr:hypothetical protein [Pseudoalteromonas sp. APC 3893]